MFKKIAQKKPANLLFLRGSGADQKDVFIAKLANMNLLSSSISYGKNF